ncbi:hypothetical protein LLEC1_01714 [Akanthomyces lecanii]|uniref:Aminoglycoside phosphotransferase domain-containing protein n=1 Tax=Cordyceps confragosa TaxID=2714763 RepID=A0A179IAS2_CORDF|nr:hypothetical protein LLEC1_01714 [Akanthomyces lecanii]
MVMPWLSYYVTTKAFIKREPSVQELGVDQWGNPAINPYIRARLRNEAAALEFVAQHSTISVPQKVRLWEENGLVYLRMSLIEGAIELASVDDSLMPDAIAKVTAELEKDILPRLHGLPKTGRIGSSDLELPFIPSRRFWRAKEDREWPMKTSSSYVFCHGDLSRNNILIDPECFKIRAIIDWESAGFYPENWELPLWKANSPQEKSEMVRRANERDVGFWEGMGTDGVGEQSHG